MSVLRVANCSGFYGDRLTAMREQLDGGPIDVLTGDYLAELTMLILGKDAMKDPTLGYARTFVRQVEECLGTALERGVKIVSNAGGLNPAGLAARLREVAKGLGLSPTIAHIEGDDVRNRAAELGFEGALTANAYLGGFGIAAALREGADVVVTGRVTDASLVVGPAVAHFGWEPGDHDRLAGAVVAGHIIECGPQATGGNFSGFSGFVAKPGGSAPLGFPIAEIADDGSCVITKHPGTGGVVTPDTVTAQLVYEIQSTRYLNPDVTTRLDSVRISQVDVDRVAVTGVRGEAPPEQLKVCVNTLGGFRNSMELVLTGLEIGAKAAWVRSQLEGQLHASDITWTLTSLPAPDADTEEGASCLLRCTVKDPDAGPVGKAFTAPLIELALASYPGFTMTAPPGPPTPYGVYRPYYIPRDVVQHTVVHADGRREVVADPAEFSAAEAATPTAQLNDPCGETGGIATQTAQLNDPGGAERTPSNPTRRVPLGTFVHARSGDKGGDANLGLWVAHDGSPQYEARVAWLTALITPAQVRALLPEAAPCEIEVYALPNLGGVNVLIRGLLGDGVAASTRFDPQAKGLGEWVRARLVDIEEVLL